MNGQNEKLVSSENAGIPTHSELTTNQTSYASPPTLKADLVTSSEVTASLSATTGPASSLVSPPTSLADDMEVDPNQTDGEAKPAVKNEQQQQEHYGGRSVVNDALTTLCRNASRHQRHAPEATVPAAEVGSRKMTTATRAPPATVTAPSDLSVAIPSPSASTSILKKPSSSSLSSPSPRPSSSYHRTNVHPFPSSTSSLKHEMETKQHNPVVDKKRLEGRYPPNQLNSNNNNRHTSPTSPHRRSKLTGRDRGSFSDPDADPDTLRLIREMQEQDFGLRKRPSRT